MKNIKNIFLILIIILIFSLFLNNIEEYITKEKEELADNSNKKAVIFLKNNDGDTARFKVNEEIIKVRFLGIDTPETPESPKETGEYWEEAKNFTKEKLEKANKIEIEIDNNAPEKDVYNRVLAWIWVDDNLLQEELVAQGFAKTYMLQDNYKYADILKEAEKKAKNERLGIWNVEAEK